MSRNNYSKILVANVTILIALLFSPGLLYKAVLLVKTRLDKTKIDKGYNSFSSKEQIDKRRAIEKEQEKLTHNYIPFIGWRKKNTVDNKFINIIPPYNTRASINSSLTNSYWFFGGSTMWGAQVTDAETIPSLFAKKTSSNVLNLGESGWTSRQSLNQLVNLLGDDINPKHVIFYDGVNDTIMQCQTEINHIPSHAQASKMKSKLDNDKLGISFQLSFLSDFIKSPYIALLRKLVPEKVSNSYNCDVDTNKARKIAVHLVLNWESAALIAKAKNIPFVAILQPTSFTSIAPSSLVSNVINSRFEKNIKDQYEIVYPLIQQEMKKSCQRNKVFCDSFVDGTKWIDTKENVFIDFCHLNKLGNSLITDKISSLIYSH